MQAPCLLKTYPHKLREIDIGSLPDPLFARSESLLQIVMGSDLFFYAQTWLVAKETGYCH